MGALASCAAQLLKFMIHGIQHFVENQLIAQDHWWYLITPMIGITLAGLFVKYIVKDDISHAPIDVKVIERVEEDDEEDDEPHTIYPNEVEEEWDLEKYRGIGWDTQE